MVKQQRLACAAAVLAGRADPTRADLWPLVYAVPDAEGQQVARDALSDLLADAESGALPAAAAEASRGPLARAALLVDRARDVLADPPSDPVGRQLRFEGLLRELDAGFAVEQRTADLIEVRERLLAALPPS